MNKTEQLHYLNTLKTAIHYIDANRNYMDNYQLLQIYKKIVHAEYKGLNSEYQLDNHKLNNKILSNDDDWDINKKWLSPDEVNGQQTLALVNLHGSSFDCNKLNTKYLESLKLSHLKGALHHSLKNVILSGLLTASLYAICIVGGNIPFIMVPFFLLGLASILNIFRTVNLRNYHVNCNLATTDDLYVTIKYIYDNYKKVVNQPLLAVKHLKLIKNNHQSWKDIHHQLLSGEKSELLNYNHSKSTK